MRRRGREQAGAKALALLLLTVFSVGCAMLPPSPRTFDVTLEVDFGPADRPAIHRLVQVERGATAGLLAATVCAVEKGAVCCDAREIAGINGVMSDPAANRWWTVSIGGSPKVSPFRTKLKPGDHVRWEYRQYEQ